MPDRSPLPRSLLLLAALGVALRAALALQGGDALRFYDERDYDALARALLDGRGFSLAHGPTGFRPPGEPLLLALVYALTGPSPLAGKLAHALLFLPVPFFLARLARLALGRSRGAAAAPWAAALAAFHPGLAFASASLYPVALTTTALVVGVTLAAETARAPRASLATAAGAGLALGGAAAATPYFAPLGVLAALALGPSSPRRGALALAAAVSLAPSGAWVARNAATLGAPTLGTHAGYNLALGANDRATVRSGNHIEPDLDRATLPDDEVARDRAYRASAKAWIAAHPTTWLALAAGRAAATLDSVGAPATQRATSALTRAGGWALAPFVALGLGGLWLRRRSPVARVIALTLALVALAGATGVVKPRFRFPVDAALAPFAVAAALRLGRSLRRSRPTGLEGAGARP